MFFLYLCNHELILIWETQNESKIALFLFQIHSEVVKQTWRGDMATKERLMVTRQQQIEQMWHHEEESKIRDKNMQVSQARLMCYLGRFNSYENLSSMTTLTAGRQVKAFILQQQNHIFCPLHDLNS